MNELCSSLIPRPGPSRNKPHPDNLSTLAPQNPQHSAHVTTWKDVRNQAVIVNGTSVFVPQLIYQPSTHADRERYVSGVTLSPPIIFRAEGTLEWGIPLTAALGRQINCLNDRDSLVFDGCGPSVSIRLQWPGYFSRRKQVHTTDYRSPPGLITKARLAKHIAVILRRFIQDMENETMHEDANPAWRVGNRHITFENLMLVSLHHVSQGSWQPQLRLM
ncbi:hypothetical protein BJ138DRAFT_34546 [Hygrophoropsis aurantiaca]|uniref:Uncharacterized protein n=1 Tax=Hygrophoropsis aurantiaca TaxID=72124 RepID=A0ACB8AD92_9AGAM|nr:hypothetical protein BJ138DRAFT_34546 [Hygrophoropsis aurantiaca]